MIIDKEVLNENVETNENNSDTAADDVEEDNGQDEDEEENEDNNNNNNDDNEEALEEVGVEELEDSSRPAFDEVTSNSPDIEVRDCTAKPVYFVVNLHGMAIAALCRALTALLINHIVI